MGNDYIARKQRRKESKRNRDDEAPRRIRKKKQPRRICRGECYKSPTLDLDSSDEDMIATVKAHRVENVPENDKEEVVPPHLRETHVQDDEDKNTKKKKKKKKMSTSSQLIAPKAASTHVAPVLQKSLQYHTVISKFMNGGRITNPLPLQKVCWPIVLKGENVYVTAQPGSGKTLSYLLPIACKLADAGHSMATRPLSPLAMVLLPTRELAQQVAAVCKLIKRHCNILRVSCLTGGSEKGRQFDSLKRSPHIIVATPGRLVDLLEDKALSLEDINSIILDEADKMLSLGFSDQLEKIRRSLIKAGVRLPSEGHDDGGYVSSSGDEDDDTKPNRASCQVGLYSATNPPGVEQISKVWCGQPRMIDLASIPPDDDGDDAIEKTTSGTSKTHSKPEEDAGPGQISKNVVQAVHVCAEHKKMNKLTKHLSSIESMHKDQRHKPKILIFANRIKTVKYIARELRGQNKKVAEIHGDKSQEEREAAIRDFKGGKFNILVASDVASRGLHVKNLAYVVNYDFPSNLETYVHRVGRTGRVDAQGHAFSFFTRSLAPIASPLIALLESHEQEIDPNLVKLAESYKIVEEKLKEQGEVPTRLKSKNSDKKQPEKKRKNPKQTDDVIIFDSQDPFVASPTFSGPKPGYVFTKGSKGIGYYLDAPRFNRKKEKKTPKQANKVKRMLPGKLARMQRRSGIPGGDSDSD